MVLAGIAIGIIALVFSWLRKLMRAGFFISFACDVLMGLIWAIIACLALVVVCRGRARVFHYGAMILGCALFLAAVSPLARIIGRGIKKGARGMARRLMKIRLVRAILR